MRGDAPLATRPPPRGKLSWGCLMSRCCIWQVREDDVSFDSSKDISEQAGIAEIASGDLDDFDKRLREKTG